MRKNKDVLTTGQVARICNVAPRTVSKWFDTGQLKGYRIPGSKDRRIPMDDLIVFMRSHGIPLNGLVSGATNMVLLDADAQFGAALASELESLGGFSVQRTSTAFEAGVAVEGGKPDVLVVDVDLPDVQAERFCGEIRSNESLEAIRLIATGAGLDEGESQRLLQCGFDAALTKPYDARKLLDTVRRLRG
jgi:excisionase family DNA binding protein